MNEMENGSGKNGTKAASEGTIAHKRRMVSGAKFGLTVFFLFVALIVYVVLSKSGIVFHEVEHPSEALQIFGGILALGLPILIGVAGLITGIQKKRPGIGVLALVLTPIGFFFALAAENRSSGKAAQPVPTDNPDSAG